MRLVENVHYAVVAIRPGTWVTVYEMHCYCFADTDGKIRLATITDPEISREDVKRHFEKMASERKAKARNRKSLAIRREKE